MLKPSTHPVKGAFTTLKWSFTPESYKPLGALWDSRLTIKCITGGFRDQTLQGHSGPLYRSTPALTGVPGIHQESYTPRVNTLGMVVKTTRKGPINRKGSLFCFVFFGVRDSRWRRSRELETNTGEIYNTNTRGGLAN